MRELTINERRLIEDFYKYLSKEKVIDKLHRGYHPRKEWIQLFDEKVSYD